jgi:hypothetical protein
MKNGTKALTNIARPAPIVTSRKLDVVWSHVDFGHELEKAKKIGANKMSNNDLLSLCRGISGYYHAHFWVDARPFFQELWQRIEFGKLRMTKTAACRKIGCTRQWANAIVSGRADKRRSDRAQAKEAKSGNLVSAGEEVAALPTDEEFVHEIRELAFAKLAPLLKDHWERYRTICAELAKHFAEASKTPPLCGKGARELRTNKNTARETPEEDGDEE